MSSSHSGSSSSRHNHHAAAFQFNNHHTQQQQQQSPSKTNGSRQAINNNHVQQTRSGFQNYYPTVGGGGTSSPNSKSSKKDSPNLMINQVGVNSTVQSHSYHQFQLQGGHVVNNIAGGGRNNVLYNNVNHKTGVSSSSSTGVTTATATHHQHVTIIRSGSSTAASAAAGGNKKGQSQNSTSNKTLVINGVHNSKSANNNNHVQKGRPASVKSQTRLPDTKGSASGIRNDSKKPASHQSSSSSTPAQTSSVPIPLASPTIEKSFKTGDDVLFNAEDGSMVFGTVGMIHGQTLQILFGDGTQQWAHFKRVTNFSACVPAASTEEEECSESVKEKGKTKYNKTGNSDNDQTSSSEEVTCGSCGTVKRVAGKKALNYHPYTSHQFNCRRCLNKSSFSKNSMIIPPAARGRTNQNHNQHSSLKLEHHHHGHHGHDRLVGDMGELTRRPDDDECFHCKGKTSYNDRLHCNLCERACHLSCLAISPTPLEGDRFWDVICSACGTQNGDSGSGGTKVFSCRRSISSWSDVAHLVLSCLGIQQAGERYFDLDLHVIPFIDLHMDRLHLPRSYKTKQAEDRKTFLRTALNNAKLRFMNIQDSHGKLTLWAIRDNNNHQGYPYRSTIPARPPSTSPIQSFQSHPSNAASAYTNKVKTPQSSPLVAVGVGNAAKSKATSSSVKSQSSSSNKLSPALIASQINVSCSSADIQSKIMASIPKTILNAKQQRNGTVIGIGGVGGAFSSVNNMASGSGSSSGLSANVSSTAQSFRPLQTTEDQLAAGSSRTLGKGSPKKISPPNLPGVTVTTSISTSEVDLKALDTAVEQSRQTGVKKPSTTATAAGNFTFREDVSISIIRPDEDSNALSTESEAERGNTDTDSDSNQNGLKMMTHHFGTKRKLSTDNNLGSDNDLSNKKQKLALDLPGFKTPVRQSSQGEEDYNISPGVQASSVNSSPISEKMSNIFKNLSGATNLISRSFPKPSPTESMTAKDTLSKNASPTDDADKNSNSGKAVKSASITPPGRNKPFQLKDKPLLRIRKPKALQVLTSKVTKKAKEAGNSSKFAGAELGKKANITANNRGRGRGRPLKGPTISNLNGVLVQPPPEVFDETVKSGDYTVMSATVEDLVKYGKGITMQCLPQPPSSTQDLVNVASKYLLMEEKPSAPSFWSSNESKCNKWERSKRDLKNLDSYEITGRMVLPDGSVKYLCSWKDGFGNAEISDEDLQNEPYYEMFEEGDYDLSDPSVVQNMVDLMDEDSTNKEDQEPEPSDKSDNTVVAVAPLIPKVEPISPKRSGGCPKSKKPGNKVNSSGHRNSTDNSSLDKDTFLVSGLGLRKATPGLKSRKENSQPDKTVQKKVEDIIDLTADSP